MLRRRPALLLLLTSTLMAGGCMYAVGAAAPGIFAHTHVNLENSSFAAVDTVIQQSSNQLTRDMLLSVPPLTEIPVKHQNTIAYSKSAYPKVGQVLGGQMRQRFIELGYNVFESQKTDLDPEIVMTGNYKFTDSRMYVTLTLTDKKQARIITVVSYSLPMAYEIHKYMDDTPEFMAPLY